MARCPFAEWKPLRQNKTQSAITPIQVILHSLTSPDIDSSWAYFDGGNAAGTEAHFLVAYDGRILQAIDTAVRADAQWQANPRAVSIETASNGGATDPWTPAQADALVRLGSWLVDAHPRIRAVRCSSWYAAGFGYHRMFDEWNHNHHSCPGDLRAKQFPMILGRIASPPPPPPTPQQSRPEEDSMVITTQFEGVAAPSYWILHAGKLVNVSKAAVGARAIDLHVTDKAEWARLAGAFPVVT